MMQLSERLDAISAANQKLTVLLDSSCPGTDKRLLSEALNYCLGMQSKDAYLFEKVTAITELLNIYFNDRKCTQKDGGPKRVKYEIAVLQSLIDEHIDYIRCTIRPD